MTASPIRSGATMAQAITVATRSDGVAVLTFDQPGSKANVLTGELWTEFGEALTALALRTELKGLVLASAKPGIFIAGADLKLLQNAPGPNDPTVRGFIEQGLRVLEQLEALPFPTCAAIDGAALGGGLEVALACDGRCTGVDPKLKLGLPEVKLGLIPGWGGTQRLPRITELQSATELITTGQALDIREAARHQGLVNSAIGSQSLSELVDDTAQSLAKPGVASHLLARREKKRQPVSAERRTAFTPPTGLTGAAAEAVRVIVEGAALPLYEAIKLETEAFMRLAGSDESKRLIAEFFASRKK
jgi:enoyl-CoA hydratase/carnithine racemase